MAYEERKDYSGKGPIMLAPRVFEAVHRAGDVRETYQTNKRNVKPKLLPNFPASSYSLSSSLSGGPQDVF